MWKTPDQDAEFWEPCKQGYDYLTLTPGDDDCCRMCPDTDAEELIPCAWCNSWAHYRCTCAVGPGRACASHFKVVSPLDKIVLARSDDPMVPESQRDKQVFPNCCHPKVREHGTTSPSNVHYTAEAIWVYKQIFFGHSWRQKSQTPHFFSYSSLDMSSLFWNSNIGLSGSPRIDLRRKNSSSARTLYDEFMTLNLIC